MSKEDKIFLEHIVQAIEKIEEYCKRKSLKEFEEHSLLQDGCMRQLAIIGEATKNISPKT